MVFTMAKDQMVFERREKKFRLTRSQYIALIKDLGNYMEMDEYGLHNIASIYYDTEDYRLIRHSMEKPAFKEKLRIRSYGTPKPQDKVFIELKKKLCGTTHKRRISLPLEEAEAYLNQGHMPSKQGQVFREIDWFVKYYQPFPRVLLSYDRIALYSKENPDFRITLDSAIRYRNYDLSLACGNSGTYIIPPDQSLMEIKSLQAIPLWLCQLLSEHKIYSQSFSKYAVAYGSFILNDQVSKENSFNKEAVYYAG